MWKSRCHDASATFLHSQSGRGSPTKRQLPQTWCAVLHLPKPPHNIQLFATIHAHLLEVFHSNKPPYPTKHSTSALQTLRSDFARKNPCDNNFKVGREKKNTSAVPSPTSGTPLRTRCSNRPLGSLIRSQGIAALSRKPPSLNCPLPVAEHLLIKAASAQYEPTPSRCAPFSSDSQPDGDPVTVTLSAESLSLCVVVVVLL